MADNPNKEEPKEPADDKKPVAHTNEADEEKKAPEKPEEATNKSPEQPVKKEKLKKGASIGSVPLNVSVQLCQIELSLKELLSLEPGKLFPLKNNPSAPVTLVVNGKNIAHAELVYLGDKLGIRLLNFT